MSERAELAVHYKHSGLNCAQAVAAAFAEEARQNQETMTSITQAMGTGIGGTLEGTCGAVVGATVVIGLACNEEGRPTCMKKANTLLKDFKEQNGSVICKELKGIETGVMLRSCDDCVRDAVHSLESLLGTN